MSPALKGRFLTTGPPGKSPEGDILDHNFSFPVLLTFGARKSSFVEGWPVHVEWLAVSLTSSW